MEFIEVTNTREAARLFLRGKRLFVDIDEVMTEVKSEYGFILSIKEGATIYTAKQLESKWKQQLK